MAVANNELQVKWATADSKSVAAAGGEPSDAIAFSATAFAAIITLKADNAAETPADGDTVDFYLLLSAGDPDGAGTGAGGSEYPNDDSDGLFLAVLDTYADDPSLATVAIPVGVACKIYGKSNASSNAIVVSACINEKTA